MSTSTASLLNIVSYCKQWKSGKHIKDYYEQHTVAYALLYMSVSSWTLMLIPPFSFCDPSAGAYLWPSSDLLWQ